MSKLINSLNFAGIYFIENNEVLIIERLGKFKKILSNGLKFSLPILDKTRKIIWYNHKNEIKLTDKINLNIVAIKLFIKNCETKDKSLVNVSANLSLRIDSPFKAVYESENLYESVNCVCTKFIKIYVQRFDLKIILDKSDVLRSDLEIDLGKNLQHFGLKIAKFEVLDIFKTS